jgi:hypothetical protein
MRTTPVRGEMEEPFLPRITTEKCFLPTQFGHEASLCHGAIDNLWSTMQRRRIISRKRRGEKANGSGGAEGIDEVDNGNDAEAEMPRDVIPRGH